MLQCKYYSHRKESTYKQATAFRYGVYIGTTFLESLFEVFFRTPLNNLLPSLLMDFYELVQHKNSLDYIFRKKKLSLKIIYLVLIDTLIVFVFFVYTELLNMKIKYFFICRHH